MANQQNFEIDFQLIGSANSLVQALQLAISELQRTGSGVSAESGKIASQISGVFANAIGDIAEASRRYNLELTRQFDDLDKKTIARKSLAQNLTRQNLLSGVRDGDFGVTADQIEKKLGKSLTDKFKTKELRQAIFSALDENFQGAFDDLARQQTLGGRYFKQLEKTFKQLGKQNILAGLGGPGKDLTGILKEQVAQISDEDFLRNAKTTLGQRGITADLLNPIGRSLPELRKQRRQLREEMFGIERDIREALIRMSKANKNSVQFGQLREFVTQAREARQQVRSAISNISDELTNQARRTPFARFLEFFKFGLIAGGFYQISNAVKTLTHDLFEAAGEFQRLRSSFVSVLADPVLRDGGGLTPELLQQLGSESARIFQDAQVNAIRTVATTKEYVTTLQTALAVGQQVGLSQKEVEDITLRMTLAAGAFGVEQEKVGSSIAQILTGSVRVTNQLARNLGLATEKEREALQSAIQRGEVYEFLVNKTKGFIANAKEVENNFINVRAAISDIVEFGGSQAIKPLFEFVNRQLIRIRDTFISGTPGTEPFKSPLVRIITTVQQAITELLPSLSRVTTEVGNLAASFGRSLGSTGVGALKTILNLLSAMLVTVRQLIDGTGGLGSIFTQAVIPALAIKAALTASISSIASIRGGFSDLRDKFSGFLNAAKNVAVEGFVGLRRPGITASADSRQLTLPGFDAQAVTRIERVKQAIGGIPAVARNAASVIGSLATSFTSFLGIAGAVVTAFTLLVNVINEYSGAADRAREADAAFQQSLEGIREAGEKRIDEAKVLANIRKLQTLAGNDSRSIDEEAEFQNIQNLFRGVLTDAEIQIVATGKLTDELREKLRGLVRSNGEDLRKLADQSETISKTTFSKLQELRGAVQEAEEADLRFGQALVAGENLPERDIKRLAQIRDQLVAELPERRRKLKEVEDAVRKLAEREKVSADEALNNADKYEQLRQEYSSLSREYRLNAEALDFQAKSTDEQINQLVAWQLKIAALRKEQLTLDQDNAEQAKRRQEIEEALQRLNFLTVNGNASLLDSFRTLAGGSEQALKKLLEGRLADVEGTIQQERATARKLIADKAEIVSVEAKARAYGTLTKAQEDNFAQSIAQIDAQITAAQGRETAAEQQSALIRTLLASTRRQSGGTGASKVSAGRDPLQDFLKRFEDQLGLVKQAQQQIDQLTEQLFSHRQQTLERIAETGALDAKKVFDKQIALLQEQTKLSGREYVALAEFLTVQAAAAKLAAERAKKTTDEITARRAAKGRTTLNPDLRDRQNEAELKIAKEQIEALKQHYAEIARIQEQITELVRRQVERRLDLLRLEADQIVEITELVTEAAEGDIDRLAGAGLLTQVEALKAKIAEATKLDDERRRQILRNLFPFLDDKVADEVSIAAARLADRIGSSAAASANDKLLASTLSELTSALDEEIPDSLDAAADRVSRIRTLIQQSLDALTSNEKFAPLGAALKELEARMAAAANTQKAFEEAVSQKKPPAAIEAASDAASKASTALSEQYDALVRLSKQFSTADPEAIGAFTTLTRLLELVGKTKPEEFAEARKALLEQARAEIERQNELQLALLQQTIDQIAAERSLVDLDNRRLDALDKIIDKKRELGLLTADEANALTAENVDRRLANLAAERALVERELRSTIPQTGDFLSAPPEVRQRILELTDAFDQLTQEEVELRLRTLELTDHFTRVGEGFAKIGEAFSQFQDTTDLAGVTHFRAKLQELAPVFEHLQGVFDALEQQRRRRAGEEILAKSGPERFNQIVDRTGSDFQLKLIPVAERLRDSSDRIGEAFSKALNAPTTGFVPRVFEAGRIIVKAGEETAEAIRGATAALAGSDETRSRFATPKDITPRSFDFSIIPETLLQSGAEAAVKAAEAQVSAKPVSLVSKVKKFLGETAGTLLEATASIVSGIAQGGAGGVLSGIGGAVTSIGSQFANSTNGFLQALPVVGQALGIVGSIFSFIGAKAREQAEKIANEVSEGIDKLKQAFQDGKITLAEAIQGINQQVVDARQKLSGGKVGKKGGKSALVQIEQAAAAAAEELRAQAAETQRAFREQLDLLRKPAELRDIISQINDARKQAEEFLRSFETQDGLLAATQEAMEFFRRTIGEIRDDIEKSLKDLRKQLKENLEDFERQKEDILRQGRVDPVVSEVEQKRRQLVELERQFRERQSDLESQIAGEQRKLDLVNKRAAIEQKIGQYVTRSADALSRAADHLGRAAQSIAGLPDSLRFGGQGASTTNQSYQINVNVAGSNASADDIGVAVARHLRLAGRTSGSRTTQFA